MSSMIPADRSLVSSKPSDDKGALSLAETIRSGPGNVVLVTEFRRVVDALICEGCTKEHSGGFARAVIVDDRSDAPLLLWMFGDGWSVSDESVGGPMAACPACQSVRTLRDMRFVD